MIAAMLTEQVSNHLGDFLWEETRPFSVIEGEGTIRWHKYVLYEVISSVLDGAVLKTTVQRSTP